MKWEFLKQLNAKVITIAAVIGVAVIGGIAALALGAASGGSQEVLPISEEQAKATAFAHAGVNENDILTLTISKDRENGVEVYEIDFTTADKSFDYDVKTSDGSILNSSYRVNNAGTEQQQPSQQTTPDSDDNVNPSTDSNTSTDTTPEATAPAGSDSSSNTTPSTSNDGQTGSAVTEQQAKAIALKDAGVSEADVAFIRVEEDWDDGRAVYDVEFYINGKEYDYEIEKSTGKILSFDYDMESDIPATNPGNTGSNVISEQEARDLALARVPGATASHIRIEFDNDDGRLTYEGEIHYENKEYEFEIDASTGKFIEWSVDYDD